MSYRGRVSECLPRLAFLSTAVLPQFSPSRRYGHDPGEDPMGPHGVCTVRPFLVPAHISLTRERQRREQRTVII